MRFFIIITGMFFAVAVIFKWRKRLNTTILSVIMIKKFSEVIAANRLVIKDVLLKLFKRPENT